MLHLQIKQGNRASFLGHNQSLRRQWEEATGVLLDVQLMPQGPAAQLLQTSPEVDLVVARNSEYPELYDQGLILSLDAQLQKLGFQLNADQDFFLFEAQSRFAGKTLALPADGDVLLLYLRRDLIEDPEEQQAFAERYGYPLAAPETWQEYADQLAFFHRPDQKLYGTVELRDPALAWMHWLARFASQAYPSQYLFDDAMKPQISTPEGLAATRSYLATLDYSPDNIDQPGSGYDLALPAFSQGHAYSLMITVAGAKLFNRKGQAITDQYSVHPLPGTRHPEGLVRRSPLAFGNNLVIPATSQQPELALLYALWLTSPEISPELVKHPGGFVDPFRYSHFRNPAIRSAYGELTLKTLQSSLPLAVPAGTGLPGNAEFLKSLNDALGQASLGLLTPEEVVKQVQKAWEGLIKEAGPDHLLPFWLEQRSLYPGASTGENDDG
ncbi:extracellular solute-binding protein [Marinospirillum sp.]|uniref:extracellular solute-binding protein n=1 Tax=Marinospirillum sp. TaxID=2183934 RepID=UPI002870ABB4|nr:extracellular solute-binding protein [Marinospirillum sp.]MDR9467236.1 extracellular solute-binding protein [Marinospirillum sp.]